MTVLNEEGEAAPTGTGGTTTTDIAVHTPKLGTPEKRRKKPKKEDEMSEQAPEFENGFKLYKEGNNVVFELESSEDFNIFHECFRKKQPKNLYYRPALNECLDQYNKSTKGAFLVRHANVSYQMQQMFKTF